MMKEIAKTCPTAPVLALPGLRLPFSALSGVFFSRLKAWRRRRSNRAILMQLNDDQLRDIGLSRDDIIEGRNLER